MGKTLDSNSPYVLQMCDAERSIFRYAFEQAHGKVVRVANLLGVNVLFVRRRLHALGMTEFLRKYASRKRKLKLKRKDKPRAEKKMTEKKMTEKDMTEKDMPEKDA